MRKVISVGDPGSSCRTPGVGVTTPPSTTRIRHEGRTAGVQPAKQVGEPGSRLSASRRPQVGLGRRASTAGSISAGIGTSRGPRLDRSQAGDAGAKRAQGNRSPGVGVRPLERRRLARRGLGGSSQLRRRRATAGDIPHDLDVARARALRHLKLHLLARRQILERDPQHKPVALALALVGVGSGRISSSTSWSCKR